MLSFIWMILALFLGITVPLPPVVVDPPQPSPVVVQPSGTEITLIAGTSQRVLLGTGYPSIWDGYSMVDKSDSATVRASVMSENTTPGCAPGGCTDKYYLGPEGERARHHHRRHPVLLPIRTAPV